MTAAGPFQLRPVGGAYQPVDIHLRLVRVDPTTRTVIGSHWPLPPFSIIHEKGFMSTNIGSARTIQSPSDRPLAEVAGG